MIEHLICPQMQEVCEQKNPKAVYTQCNAHCLNLAILHSCDRKHTHIYTFLSSQPKRQGLLVAVINNICPNKCWTTQISACRTCCMEKHDMFKVFNSLFRVIIKTWQ